MPPTSIAFPGRILFLTGDPALLRRQLAGEDLPFDAAHPPALRDDISTDEITPAWACYHHDETLGDFPYVGVVAGGETPVGRGAVRAGGFAVSVSGRRRGKGSSREASPYAERAAGIRLVVAASFERIYRENCRNLGIFTSTDFGLVARIRAGEAIPLEELLRDEGAVGREVATYGGLLAHGRARLDGRATSPVPATATRPMTLAEKILARHWVRDAAAGGTGVDAVAPGDEGFVRADLRFSHDYVTPMAAAAFEAELGLDARVAAPESVLLFRDHLTLVADAMASEHVAMGLLDVALALEAKQRAFAGRQGLALYGELADAPAAAAALPEEPEALARRRRAARRGGSEAICHAKVLESHALPGQVVVGSDSHTPHAGALGCVAFGVGTTAIATAWLTRDAYVRVPGSVRVEVRGALAAGVAAKDVMLALLRHPFVREGRAVGRIVEYAGDAVAAMSLDERATLTNMAAEVGALTGIVAPDARTAAFLVERRGTTPAAARAACAGLAGDADAAYEATLVLDGAALRPMVALPGDPGNGVAVAELGAPVPIDIAYAGSCTGGKREDMDMYARVFAAALARGERVAPGVRCLVQCGSRDVWEYCRAMGYDALFAAVGATLVAPSCGACINAGPGVSRTREEVTVSAINRNFPGRSGPGRLYLASPYTVAASAIAGRIVAWEEAPR